MGGIERASSHEVIHNQTRLTIKGFVFAQVLVVGLSLEVILQMEGNVVGLPIGRSHAEDILAGKKHYECRKASAPGVGRIQGGDTLSLHWYTSSRVNVKVVSVKYYGSISEMLNVFQHDDAWKCLTPRLDSHEKCNSLYKDLYGEDQRVKVMVLDVHTAELKHDVKRKSPPKKKKPSPKSNPGPNLKVKKEDKNILASERERHMA